MKTLIVGLGNPILSDDGVGVKVAFAVEEALANQANGDIHVTEACVGGLRLMEMLVGYDRAILIDALKLRNGSSPGTIHQMTLDDLREISPTQHSTSSHDMSLVNALDMGRRVGLKLPEEISIYAIEVENITDFSEESTPAVTAAIPIVERAVLADLRSS